MYVNCTDNARPRALLASVLQQLRGGKRMRDGVYECGTKSDSMADFRLQLPGEMGRVALLGGVGALQQVCEGPLAAQLACCQGAARVQCCAVCLALPALCRHPMPPCARRPPTRRADGAARQPRLAGAGQCAPAGRR